MTIDPETAEQLRDYLKDLLKRVPQADLPELEKTMEAMIEADVNRTLLTVNGTIQ